MGILRRHQVAALVALAAVGALSAGCAGQDGSPTVTRTVTATAPSTVETSRAPTSVAESPPLARDGRCRSTGVDDPLTGEEPVPVRSAGRPGETGYFHYAPPDESPDPCMPLSWVTLSGSNGDRDSPAHTTGSFRQTVAFFADGTLVTEPAPILARRIESVDRVDDATVRVDYAFHTDAPAVMNETVPGSATFHWNGRQLVVSENTVPVELNDSAETLDLDSVS
jgi:hypothetical protein